MEAHKLVVAVRSDLKLSKGKLAAQVGHASVECALRSRRYDAKAFDAWYGAGQKKAVVKCADLQLLLRIKAHAESLGITTALIEDAGHTEVAPGTVTVLGVGPARETLIDQVTGALPLL